MPRSSSPLAGAGVVVPVRSFARGKSRLAGALDADAHEAFVRELAERAVDAARGRPTVVVSSAPEVVAWASARGVATIPDPGSLDEAAHDGRAWAAEQGCTRVVVVHADLPDITSLDGVAGEGVEAVIVPCHRDDGTPALSVPVDAPFEFAYGPGSFDRHVAAAQRAGLDVRIVRDPALRFDVDGPDDLAAVLDRRPSAR